MGLGARLDRRVRLAGVLVPWLFLLPLAGDERMLGPTDLLAEGALPHLEPVPGGDRYGLLNDPVYQFVPWEVEIRRAWRRGAPGFWSDSLEGGSSPWVNPQARVLSPFTVAARPFPLRWFFLLTLGLQLQTAGLGMVVWARRLGAGRRWSAAAGAAYAFGGALLPWALFPHSGAAAWIPWTAAAFLGLMRHSRPETGRIVWAAVTLGLLLLSGHPEIAFGGGLLAALVGWSLRPRRAGTARRLVACLRAGLLGGALAAPVVLPFLAALPDSQRWHEMQERPSVLEEWRGDSGRLFPEDRRGFLAVALNPYGFGVPYRDAFRGPFNWAEAGAGYAGSFALAGSLLALLLVRRRAAPLLLFAGLSYLLAAGFRPFLLVAEWLPGFATMAHARLLLVACAALCAAAAVGFRRLEVTGAIAPLAALLLLAVASALRAPRPEVVLTWLLLLAVALLVIRGDRWRRWAPVLVLALVVDLAPWGWRLLPTAVERAFYPTDPVVEQAAAAAQHPLGPGRVTGFGYEVYPSLLAVYGLDEPRPHNPMAPGRLLEVHRAAFGAAPSRGAYFSPVRSVDHPLADFLGLRAVVLPPAVEAPPGYEVAARSERVIARNLEARPRWFVVEGECSIEGGTLAPGRLRFTVSGAAPCRLATSLPGPDGWRLVGGPPARTVETRHAFLGVRVDQAPTRIELSYRPPGLALGLALLLVAVGGEALGWAAPRLATRRAALLPKPRSVR